MQSATIQIVNHISEDQLLLTNTALTSNYDDGILSIDTPANVMEYEAAINSILYNNTVEEPTNGSKRIRITVMDSPLFNATTTTNNPLPVANSSTSDPIEIS